MAIRTLSFALLVVLLTACGGSGGGSTPAAPATPAGPPALSAGEYWYAAIGARTLPAIDSFRRRGTWVSNGGGALLPISGSLNISQSAFSGPTLGVSFMVGADRSLTLGVACTGLCVVPPFGTSGPRGEGRISPWDDIAICAVIENSADPELSVFVQKGAGGFSVASLVGKYHFAGFQPNGPLPGADAVWGEINFDGAGGGTVTLGTSNGTTVTTGVTGTVSYHVLANGTFHLSFIGGSSFNGGIMPGGEIAVVSDTASGIPPVTGETSVLCFVRATGGAGRATFAGNYQIAAIGFDDVDGFSAIGGTLDADGIGGGTLTPISNTEGTVSASAPEPFTYDVDPDGTLRLADFEGGITGDGRFAVLGGGTVSGSEPTFIVLLR